MSRYLVRDNKLIMDIFKVYPWLIERPIDTEIKSYVVIPQTAGYTRKIANIVYGNHDLHWIISSFNYKWYGDISMVNDLNWPYSGTTIYYPSRLIINTML